jgi:hypothetical protein
MFRFGVCTAIALLMSVAACGGDGNVSSIAVDAALPVDAITPDAIQPDAKPDGRVPEPANEITAGAKALTGTTHKADVQIGHAMSQAPVGGNGRTLQGNAAVKP